MEAWLRISLLWLAFGGSHVAMSSLRMRPWLIDKLGDRGFLGVYSLVSLATFVPLVQIYVSNRHSGALLWNLSFIPGLHTIVLWISGACFTLAVASFFQPSPASLGAGVTGQAVRARGLTRITRHPLFMPFALLAPAHLLINGFATDVAFFAGLGIFSILGCMHQDARKRVTDADTLATFFGETSLFPLVAIVTGKTKLVASELPWIGLGVGLGAAVTFYRLHGTMFG